MPKSRGNDDDDDDDEQSTNKWSSFAACDDATEQCSHCVGRIGVLEHTRFVESLVHVPLPQLFPTSVRQLVRRTGEKKNRRKKRKKKKKRKPSTIDCCSIQMG
mmetsp:Transcript_21032/g.49654  ORF Transcript_21032/g.49654 Transcript_21032/m.49654 type:complete len:103 (+) Transcript_21032:1413-1721(+)